MHARCLLLALLAVPASAQGEAVAEYRVRFEATWSNTTHPGAYPGGAHFSPLVGATHNGSLRLWEEGGLATPGIELMAETGGTNLLLGEIEDHITAGLAGESILGNGIGSPGQTGRRFTVTNEFPLVSLVTMIAPSPDWFVGVDSVSLIENGEWVDVKTIELYAYDSGTDSGLGFNSGNQDTNPQEPISLQTGGPFFATTPLGTFTFTRKVSTMVYGCGVNPAGSLTVDSLPTLGEPLVFTVNDPTGMAATPAVPALVLSVERDTAFPCGTLVPGLGLGGGMGELLVGDPRRVLTGPAFMGAPVNISLTIPNQPALSGLKVYAQAFLTSPGGAEGATEAIELFLGQ